MDDFNKKRLAAAAKVAVGAGKVVSGMLTVTGHGFLGTICRNHHMMNSAVNIGTRSFRGGMAMLEEGWNSWPTREG